MWAYKCVCVHISVCVCVSVSDWPCYLVLFFLPLSHVFPIYLSDPLILFDAEKTATKKTFDKIMKRKKMNKTLCLKSEKPNWYSTSDVANTFTQNVNLEFREFFFPWIREFKLTCTTTLRVDFLSSNMGLLIFNCRNCSWILFSFPKIKWM